MIARAMCELRGKAFWGLDYATGGAVKKAYRELKAFDAMDSRSPQLMEHQESALRKLLQHAGNTTKFYKSIRGSCLDDFPIVDKNIIREQQSDFMSSKYDKADLVSMATSGSTGTPFVCYQNRGKKKRVNAEVIYYSEKAGYRVGSNLIYLRVVTDKTRKSRLLQWIQNETLIDISNLDDEHIDELLGDIEKASHRGSMMLAYASTCDALKDYFRRKGHSVAGSSKIHGLVSSSEMLFDDTRDAMSKAFNCRCFSRYSNQENGIIGQDDVENNTLILNEAHYIVEIFKMDTNEPAAEGQVGRIVITDLYNYAMPMIRYDTGDIGSIVYVERDGVKKKAITDFGGRRVDAIFDCYGRRLSPHCIGKAFSSFPEIRQWQFIQESKTRYTVRINVKGKSNRRSEVEALLLAVLGAEAAITVELVDEVPVLASGKRRYIVCKMN